MNSMKYKPCFLKLLCCKDIIMETTKIVGNCHEASSHTHKTEVAIVIMSV